MEYFGLKLGQDLGNRAAHPYQEFQGVPPGRLKQSNARGMLKLPVDQYIISETLQTIVQFQIHHQDHWIKRQKMHLYKVSLKSEVKYSPIPVRR